MNRFFIISGMVFWGFIGIVFLTVIFYVGVSAVRRAIEKIEIAKYKKKFEEDRLKKMEENRNV